MTQQISWESLPCGCRIAGADGPAHDGENFLIQPHSMTCEFYLYAVAECERQGKTVQYVGTP